MKRALIGLCVIALLVAGAGAGGAYYIGGKSNEYLDEATHKIAAQLPFMRVAKIDVDKNLLQSVRTTTFEFGCTDPSGKPPVSIQVQDVVRHGPLPDWTTPAAAVVDSAILLSPETQKAVGGFFGGKPPLEMRTVLNFDGTYHQTFSVPAGSATLPDGTKATWRGMNGTASGQWPKGPFTSDAVSEGFEAGSADSNAFAKVGRIRMQTQGEFDIDALWTSPAKMTFTIGTIEVALPNKAGQAQRAKFGQLLLTSDTTINQDLLSSTSRLQGSAVFNDLKFDTVEFETSFRRLHAPTYARMVQAMLKSSFNCETMGNPKAGPEMLQAMQSDLMKMLPYNPEYAVDKIRVVHDGKEASVSYSAGVQGVTTEDIKDAEPAAMMPVLMPKIVFKSEAKFPVDWMKHLVTNLPQSANPGLQPENLIGMLKTAAAKEWIVLENGYITAKFGFSGGQALLNGKPFQPGTPTAQADPTGGTAQ